MNQAQRSKNATQVDNLFKTTFGKKSIFYRIFPNLEVNELNAALNLAPTEKMPRDQFSEKRYCALLSAQEKVK